MGRGYKNRISGKVKKNSKFCSKKILGGRVGRNLGAKKIPAENLGGILAGKFLSMGPSAFFQKIAIFLFSLYDTQNDV
jgi:hypothetical protein